MIWLHSHEVGFFLVQHDFTYVVRKKAPNETPQFFWRLLTKKMTTSCKSNAAFRGNMPLGVENTWQDWLENAVNMITCINTQQEKYQSSISKWLFGNAFLRGWFWCKGRHKTKTYSSSMYIKHLKPYHGGLWVNTFWHHWVKCQREEREIIIAKLGGMDMEKLMEECDALVLRKLKMLVEGWDPLLSSWNEDFKRLGLEDTRTV